MKRRQRSTDSVKPVVATPAAPPAPAENPVLAKLTSANVTVASVIVFVAIMAVSAVLLKPHFDNPTITLTEAPLAKNTEFQLQPGEEYTYAYLVNGTEVNATYEILSGSNCTIIAFMETDPPSTSCVDRWGMDARGYNSMLENPDMMLFDPWMLALTPDWSWNTTMYMDFVNDSQYVASMDYQVIRMDTWHGREAFVVMENVSGGEPQYEWVDAQERIMLMTSGDGYEIDLVSGLPLDNESG
jgi:hypothetical protein